jgi:hypothetical protein
MPKPKRTGKKKARPVTEFPDLEEVQLSKREPDDSRSNLRPGPSLEAIKKKYGAEDALAADAADVADAEADPDEVEVRQFRNKKTAADPANDPGPRAMIFSKKKGFTGSQG